MWIGQKTGGITACHFNTSEKVHFDVNISRKANTETCEGIWLAQDQLLQQHAVRLRNNPPSHNRFLLKLLQLKCWAVLLAFHSKEMTAEGNTGGVALSWTHGTLLAPWAHRAARGERSSSCHQAQLPSHLTTASHCSAQPESPHSLSPLTFTFLYRSVRFLPQTPCQPPKTSSPGFLHSVWCLSAVLHLQSQSTALSFASTNIQLPGMIPPRILLITSFSPILLP